MRPAFESKITLRILLPIAVIGMLFFQSCTITKNVPPNQFLLNNTKIKVKNGALKSDLYTLVKQKENRKIFWIYRFKLRFYSSFIFKRDSESKFRNSVGEPPVIYDSISSYNSIGIMSSFLRNKGYYQNNVTFEERVQRGNKKKLNLVYKVELGKPTIIGSVSYDIENEAILEYISREMDKTNLVVGDNFDLDKMESERSRVTLLLKNQGLFFFSNDLIFYKADTLKEKRKVHLSMHMKQNPNKLFSDDIKVNPYKTYKLNNVVVSQDLEKTENSPLHDTLEVEGYSFLNGSSFFVKPKALTRTLFLAPRDFYTYDKHENTIRRLSALNNYKYINITYDRSTNPDTNYFLDCFISLIPSKPKSFSIETNGTTTGGNLGINGSFSVQNRNAFRGAEILKFKLSAGAEAQSVKTGDEKVLNNVLNTYEIGPEISCEFPKFLLPVNQNIYSKSYIPKTTISVSYNYQQRPDYTRGLVNTNLNYWWRETKTKSHSVMPVSLSQIKVDKTDKFIERLDSINNRALTASYEDIFIPSLMYSFVYNNQVIKKDASYQIFRGNMEFAGNLANALSSGVLNLEQNANGQYLLNGIPYSQFFRAYTEYIHNLRINGGTNLVGRAFVGLGVPYGNSTVLPFVRSFFSGGTNGIRAWQARTIGPGTTPDSLTSSSGVDQIGDIKIEFNLEYRFKIISFLEGAVFTDIGNIWVLNNPDYGEEAQFNVSNIFHDIAIGAGVGARLNFNFFIIRFDVANRIKDPGSSEPTSIKFNHYNYLGQYITPVFNFAIGYPF
ncbi:MAG TPA: hypothetical protein DCX54_06105 [Flavobacteriales bacterium]|nr:hypothetical protein [Flavobacteriales bacterium]